MEENRIKVFRDGTYIMYDTGYIDSWRVNYCDSTKCNPPRDVDYFLQLKNFSLKYGADKMYSDFVIIYNMTKKDMQVEVLNKISQISNTYSAEDSLQIDKLFSILYSAMVSEENYPGTRLGRRIKRLGIYKMLFEDAEVHYAANFMRGMQWRDIAKLCDELGF